MLFLYLLICATSKAQKHNPGAAINFDGKDDYVILNNKTRKKWNADKASKIKTCYWAFPNSRQLLDPTTPSPRPSPPVPVEREKLPLPLGRERVGVRVGLSQTRDSLISRQFLVPQ